MNSELKNERKNSTIYNEVRSIINNFNDDEIKNILRIAYIFAAAPSEYLGPRKTKGYALRGNDFSVETIDNNDVLTLKIPTNRMGRKIRTVAISLNPNIEPMSKEILKFSEEKGDSFICDKYYEQIWDKLDKNNIFKSIMLPVKPYKKRKDLISTFKQLTFGFLYEIRLLELGICHNFNEHDFKMFCGDTLPSNYRTYLNKLFIKTDYYDKKDVYETLILKNTIFNPQKQFIYHYKDYMTIQKLIKRKKISKTVTEIPIDTDISINHLTATRSGKRHKILMANVMKMLEINSQEVLPESYNFDVMDSKQNIIVECGQTNAEKLLDLYKGHYHGLDNINNFWIMNYWGYPHSSRCYKFIINR